MGAQTDSGTVGAAVRAAFAAPLRGVVLVRSGRRLVLAAIAALLFGVPAGEADARSKPDKLVFVFSRGPADPYTRWLNRLYTEALGRLGIKYEFLEVPPNRATAMSSGGQVDGELGRTYEFAALYPTLVRVEEPNNVVLFSAYAITPMDRIDGWEPLRRSTMTLVYRAGIKEVEEELANPVYRGRTTSVSSVSSGLLVLQRRRADVYVDVQNAVEPSLVFPDPRLDPNPDVLPRLVGVLQRTTGHAYLHERHRALAPELAAVLRTLKEEGVTRRYLIDTFVATTLAEGMSPERAKAEAEIAARGISGGP